MRVQCPCECVNVVLIVVLLNQSPGFDKPHCKLILFFFILVLALCFLFFFKKQWTWNQWSFYVIIQKRQVFSNYKTLMSDHFLCLIVFIMICVSMCARVCVWTSCEQKKTDNIIHNMMQEKQQRGQPNSVFINTSCIYNFWFFPSFFLKIRRINKQHCHNFGKKVFIWHLTRIKR